MKMSWLSALAGRGIIQQGLVFNSLALYSSLEIRIIDIKSLIETKVKDASGIRRDFSICSAT